MSVAIKPKSKAETEAEMLKHANNQAKEDNAYNGEDTDWEAFYENYGIDITDSTEEEYICTCPFTDKEGKLYISKKNGLWDSKTYGMNGNPKQFIEELYRWSLEKTNRTDLLGLSVEKQIPIGALEDYVALNPLTRRFMIPDFSVQGNLCGISSYIIGGKCYKVRGSFMGLRGAAQLLESQAKDTWLAEGEWDYILLRHAIKVAGVEDEINLVCMPGAGTFRAKWRNMFHKRSVKVLYDNDKAGRNGRKKVYKGVEEVVTSIEFLEWGSLHEEGDDIRDLYIKSTDTPSRTLGAVKALQFLTKIKSMFHPVEGFVKKEQLVSKKIKKKITDGAVSAGFKPDEVKPEIEGDPIGANEFEAELRKHLQLRSNYPMDVIFGTVFANKIHEDPVWTFIVAPPSGSKTELLMTMALSPQILTTTTLTPAAMVSGYEFEDGEDPSILLKVNGKTLVIKDFTTLLTINKTQRDEVFGYLRDIYDGQIEKYFGNGIHKAYNCRFGILAGVTPVIDALAAENGSLGERFLKFRINRFMDEGDEEERVKMALMGGGKEDTWRHDLQTAAGRVLKKEIYEVPFNPEYVSSFTALSMLTALFRSSIVRDSYSKDILCMPVTEVATRLAKQFSALAKGICIYRDFETVNDYVLDVIRMVAMDTIPDKVSVICKVMNTILAEGGTPYCAVHQIGERLSSLPNRTIEATLTDLAMVGAVEAIPLEGSISKHFRFSKKAASLLGIVNIFADSSFSPDDAPEPTR